MTIGDIQTLYKNRPATLWVEDQLTRSYLLGIWGGSLKIGILVAGGVESVRGITSKAREGGYECVFGLQDRDFGPTNRPGWSSRTDVFRLDMHETENALIGDPDTLADALSALGRSRTGQEIHAKLTSQATNFVWGMAAGAALRWLHRTVNEDFPASALSAVKTQADAESLITSSPWWNRGLPQLSTSSLLARLGPELTQRHADYSKDLQSDRFLVSFSGKELLGPIQGWLLQGRKPDPSLDDLVKAVAAAQVSRGTVPLEIQEIQQHILDAIQRRSSPRSA